MLVGGTTKSTIKAISLEREQMLLSRNDLAYEFAQLKRCKICSKTKKLRAFFTLVFGAFIYLFCSLSVAVNATFEERKMRLDREWGDGKGGVCLETHNNKN